MYWGIFILQGRRFLPATPISLTNKFNGHIHNTAELLTFLKMAFNTYNPILYIYTTRLIYRLGKDIVLDRLSI